MGTLTLVLGGARSGKSRFAESLAQRHGGRVLYLATLEPGDDEMARRVEAHRQSRPAEWRTIEEPLDPMGALEAAGEYDVCLLDCLTLWLSNLLLAMPDVDVGAGRSALDSVRGLIAWQRTHPGALIAVSNEVGSGVVPEYALGRLYRDVLGEANQLLAAASDQAFLCVAGYAIDLKAVGQRIER